MKKILIINLRRLGDVFSTGHIISSLQAEINKHALHKNLGSNFNNEKSGTEISLLVYSESLKAAENLSGVKEIITIDRKEILTILNNKLFSNHFALEIVYERLQRLKSKNFDMVINYSNDSVAANLTSYLADTSDSKLGVQRNSANSTNSTPNKNIDIKGISFSRDRSIVSKNDWEIVFNDILPTLTYSPIHFTDCYHNLIGIQPVIGGEKLVQIKKHNDTAFHYINELRNNFDDEVHVRTVAICANASSVDKSLGINTVISLIDKMLIAENYLPLLLISPSIEDKEFARKINKEFDDKLVIVEAELRAVHSVINNCDLLVTVDTAIKHIADLSELPTIEVSLGWSPFFKQGTTSTNNLIITQKISERRFQSGLQESLQENLQGNLQDEHVEAKNKISKSDCELTALDIFEAIEYFFAPKTNAGKLKSSLSKNVSVYQCQRDQYGIFYSNIAGCLEEKIELQRAFERTLLYQLIPTPHASINKSDSKDSKIIMGEDLKFALTHYNSKLVNEWCVEEKNSITNLMKELLGALRSLIQMTENKKIAKEFTYNLGRIISHCDGESITSIPAIIFRSKLEAVSGNSLIENIKDTEALLYSLKSNVQITLNTLKAIEDYMAQNRKDLFQKRGGFEKLEI